MDCRPRTSRSQLWGECDGVCAAGDRPLPEPSARLPGSPVNGEIASLFPLARDPCADSAPPLQRSPMTPARRPTMMMVPRWCQTDTLAQLKRAPSRHLFESPVVSADTGVPSRLVSSPAGNRSLTQRHEYRQNRLHEGRPAGKEGACGLNSELRCRLGGCAAHELRTPS